MAFPLEALVYRSKNRLVNLVDRPVVVLLYHRVAALAADPQQLAVSPENFRAQMRFLQEHFPVARFEEDWTQVARPAVVVTFDDGYADNALEALPILEESGVPATFFVSTATIGTRREFWWDELEHLILEEHACPDRFVLADAACGKSWPTATAAERRVLFDQIQPLFKGASASRQQDWLGQLRRWAQVGEAGCETHRAMTVAELQRLAGSRLATIGAHGVTHAALGALPPDAQREEIVASKRQLEAWLGREVAVFSYPFGARTDYTAGTARLCREAGFRKAAANFPAQTHGWTDPWQIPRYLVRNWPVDLFARKLEEFWIS